MPSPLRIVPLGGLGEVGMNCMAFEQDGEVIVVDCGVTFPDRRVGVDVIHADLRWLAERRDRVRGLIVTHGHEDHIGAVPYLMRALGSLPLYGPPYALSLVRERLREHPSIAPVMHPTRPRGVFKIGPFEIEPLRVTHSIADATALAIKTASATVVHTGDFKIDDSPTDHEHLDMRRFEELGEAGVDCLLSDSTNALVKGRTASESDVARALEEIVRNAPNRIVVAMFASNVHRLRALFRAARETGRKVCLLGRSVGTHVRVASELGYLKETEATLIPAEEGKTLPRDKVLVIAGGSQGEPAAALTRLSQGTFPFFEVEDGDEVVMSSRVIPGNEHPVYALMNRFERRGIHVRFWSTHPHVHASGHAHRDEQRAMIRAVRPRNFVPVHGTLLQLRAHAGIAREEAVPNIVVIENGAVLEVDRDGVRVVGEAPVGRVHIAGVLPIDESILRARDALAERGVATVVIALDRRGALLGAPRVVTEGLLTEAEAPAVLREASRFVEIDLARHRSPRLDLDIPEIEERAARALRRFFGHRTGQKPITSAVVVTA